MILFNPNQSVRLHSDVIFQSVRLWRSPDCVGDFTDTEAAGGLLRRLPPVVPPHIPLHLRHKLERLSYFTPVLRVLGLHGVKPVHVLGGPACDSRRNLPKHSLSQISFFMSAGPVYGEDAETSRRASLCFCAARSERRRRGIGVPQGP